MAKLRYDLIPPEGLRAIAEALTWGESKHKDGANGGLESVPILSDVQAKIMRHLEATRLHGINAVDEESGLPHAWLLATNAIFYAVRAVKVTP